MKLVSIINVWADCVELLPFVIKNHLDFCDGVIVVWSTQSNHFNKDDSVLHYILRHGNDPKVNFNQVEPRKGWTPLQNETMKRNCGLDIARKKDFTHYLMADADEFYDPEDMRIDRQRVEDENLNGLVSRLIVYVGKPTLFTTDHTLVPQIHRLTRNCSVGTFRDYPFAYDSNGGAHIDPSRRPFFLSGVKMSNTICHHMSYVRKNIHMKIENSTANLRRSRDFILQELEEAKPGHVSKLYHRPLQESPNYFNIEL